MTTKLRAFASAAAATFLLAAGSAGAAVFVTTTPGPDVGPAAGESFQINFDGPSLPAGVTIAGNGGVTTTGTAPLGDATPFLVTPLDGDSGSVEVRFADFLGNRDVSHFSLYWGSIDSFNTLQLFDRSANQIVTLSGATLLGDLATGSPTDPSANRRVFFTLTGDSQNLGSLRFTSTSPSFEVDSLGFAPIPEPGLWALMLVGVGGLGAAMRRQRGTLARRLA